MTEKVEKDIIEKKNQLICKCTDLGEITRVKWTQTDSLKLTIQKEELVLRDIAILTKELEVLKRTLELLM